MYENNFLDRMALGKAAAERERSKDRGGSTVRVYATTVAMHGARRPLEDGERSELERKIRLANARIDAYEAVNFALFGHTWEGL